LLRFECQGFLLEDGAAITWVCAVSAGIPATAGAAGRIFRSLADAKINIAIIEIKTSCLIAVPDGVTALTSVHKGFELDRADN